MISKGIDMLIAEFMGNVDRFGLLVALIVTFILLMIVGEREKAVKFDFKEKIKDKK